MYLHTIASTFPKVRGSRPTLRGNVKMLPPHFGTTDAPAAVGTVQSMRRTEIHGSFENGITMRFCGPLAEVVNPTTAVAPIVSTYPGGRFFGSNDGKTSATLYPYTIGLHCSSFPMYYASSTTTWDSGVVSPASSTMSFIGRNFSRYRCKSFRLHYRPRTAPTDASSGFGIVITQDPAHHLFGLTDGPADLYPNFVTLEQAATSVFWPSWMPWSAEFPVTTEWRYSYFRPKYAAGTATVVYDDHDLRQSCFGAMCLLADQVATAVTMVGELYWDVEMEFADATPPSTNLLFPALAPEEKESKEEKKFPLPPPPTPELVPVPLTRQPRLVIEPDDPDWAVDPSPRRYRPAPTSAPGGSLYTPSTSSGSGPVKKSSAK